MSSHNGLPRSFVKGFILFTYLRDCSVKTELVCRDNYAKNSLNRFQIGCIVCRQFSMSSASESTSGQWTRSAENWTITSANSNNILSAILSHTPCGLSSLIQFHFFSEPGPMNDHCPFPNLLAYKDTSRAFARFFFHCLLFHKKCHSTSTFDWVSSRILPRHNTESEKT